MGHSCGTGHLRGHRFAGQYSFGELPGGSYTLKAKYPYFETIEEPIQVDGDMGINHQLQQVFQFWVEPAETTFSLSAETSGSLGKGGLAIRSAVVNLTDDTVVTGAPHGPLELLAVSPVDHSWPFVPNLDNRDEYCHERYEWLGADNFTVPAGYTIEPKDTIQSSNWVDIGKTCVEPGIYLVFYSTTDAWHYPEYFNAGHFWDPNDPQTWIYTPLNRTLLRKKELFRPAVLHVTE